MAPPASTAGRTTRRWTRDTIIEKLQEWASLYGEPPTAADWNPSVARWRAQEWRIERYRAGDWPSLNAAKRHFGDSFDEALRAAGFEPRRSGPRARGADAEASPGERALRGRLERAEGRLDEARGRARRLRDRARRLDAARAREAERAAAAQARARDAQALLVATRDQLRAAEEAMAAIERRADAAEAALALAEARAAASPGATRPAAVPAGSVDHSGVVPGTGAAGRGAAANGLHPAVDGNAPDSGPAGSSAPAGEHHPAGPGPLAVALRGLAGARARGDRAGIARALVAVEHAAARWRVTA